MWQYFIFFFGLLILPILPKRELYDGKVWTLLCDLSFGDDLSHKLGWTHRELNPTLRHARPAC